MLSRRNRWMGLVLAVAVLAASCSDDAPGEQSESYADAIAEGFDPTPDRPTGQVGHCFGDAVEAALGTERLAALGTPEEVADLLIADERALGLSADEADDVAAAFVDCGPDISRGVAADLMNNYGVREIEQPGCLAAAGRPLAVAFFAAAFSAENAESTFALSEAAMIAGDLLGCGARLADDMRTWLVSRLDLGASYLGAGAELNEQHQACVGNAIDDAALERFLTGELGRTNSSVDTLLVASPEVFGPVEAEIAACF